MEEITVLPYDWSEVDAQTDIDDEDLKLSIRGWTIDKDSNPVLVRIENYTPFVQIEMPTKPDFQHKWSPTLIQTFMQWLKSKVPGISSHQYQEKHRIYYYDENKYPFVEVHFYTNTAMRDCVKFLRFERYIPKLGKLKFNVHEDKINSVTTARKMLAERECGFSQWFSCKGKRVPPEYMVSTFGRKLTSEESKIADMLEPGDILRNKDNEYITRGSEYIIDWETIKGIPVQESKFWISHPGILSFDIETYSKNHRMLPQMFNTPDVVYMISAVYHRYGKMDTIRRFGILMGIADEDYAKEPDVYGHPFAHIICVKTEYELIKVYGMIVNVLDPEIITGFNISGYDYPYLDAKLLIKGNTWPRMGRIQQEDTTMDTITWHSSAYGQCDFKLLKMAGRINIDVMTLVRRDHKLPKYTLDTVAKHFINETKHDVKAIQMFIYYENNLAASKSKNQTQIEAAKKQMAEVMKYCIQDSELVSKLFEFLKCWQSLGEMSNVVGVTMSEVITRGQGIRVTSQVYQLSTKEGFVMTSRDIDMKKYSGGFVGDPIVGLHDNIICVDFQSLYPSIIIAYNLCYTTLCIDDTIPDEDCNILEFDEEEDIYETKEIPKEASEIDDLGDSLNFGDDEVSSIEESDADIKSKIKLIIGDTEEESNKNKKPIGKKINHYKYRFVKPHIRKGILPSLLESLVAERRAVRKFIDGVKDPDTGAVIIPAEQNLAVKDVLDKRQLALKVSCNSMYGGLGSSMSKLALLEAARAVTATGRMLIGKVNDYLVEKYKAKIVYNDSVAKDTPVLVRKLNTINGTYTRICDIIDFSENDNRDDGKQERHVNDLEIWSDMGWTPIKRIIRHKTTKKMYRIMTHTGCIDVTEDHSLLDDNGLMISPKDVSIGSKLLHKSLPDIVSNITDEVPDLFWLYGFFLAEGSCGIYNCKSGKKVSWAISNKNIDELERARSIAMKYFDFNFKIYDTIKSSNAYKLSPVGKGIIKFVSEWREMFYTGPSSKMACDNEKMVPEFLYNRTLEERRAFIEGFYVGDGNKTGNLVWDQKGKIASAGLFYLVTSIGYAVSINEHSKKQNIYRCTLTGGKQRKMVDVIKKIRELPPSDDYVYDIETDNHHFSAGIGCLVVHNTDSSMADLGITDSKLVNQWGIRIAQEISGVRKGTKLWNGQRAIEDIPGLFPPPLAVDFEKGMRMLALKKKKYMAFLVGSNGEFKKKKNSDEPEVLLRGITLARRDNSMCVRKLYTKIMHNVLNLVDVRESFHFIIDYCVDILSGKLDYRDYLVIRSLGAYAADSKYFMKSFGEQLKRAGKPPAVGERIEYLIIKTKEEENVGNRMRSVDQYVEAIDAGESMKIDYEYYISKQLIQPIDQLFSIGYKTFFDHMDELYDKNANGYQPPKGTFVDISQPIGMITKMLHYKHDIDDIILLKSYFDSIYDEMKEADERSERSERSEQE